MSNQAKALPDPIIIGDPLAREAAPPQTTEIEVDGKVVTVNSNDGRSILELLLAAGQKPPNSCRAGICMACMAVVESGTVNQAQQGSLSATDLRDRKILACQAVPASKKLKLRFIG